jgi:hypothetical protein
MRIAAGNVEVVIMMPRRLTEIDVFSLDPDQLDRPDAHDCLPRGLVIVEVPGISVPGVVAPDLGFAGTGADVKSQYIIGERRSRRAARSHREQG